MPDVLAAVVTLIVLTLGAAVLIVYGAKSAARRRIRHACLQRDLIWAAFKTLESQAEEWKDTSPQMASLYDMFHQAARTLRS